jgi:hydrogenase maturation protein HypF
MTAQIPHDRAICRACLQDVRNPNNRRYQYPFTTCAACGPRYSLLTAMPFDRKRTTMRVFPLCDDCRQEYEDPSSRRFHAQTMSCPSCGPRLWVSGRHRSELVAAHTPLEIAAAELREGRILAMRGIGGYQLLTDATSPSAVRRLRERKLRASKPFAVLCRDLADARQLAHVSPAEAEQLESAANPIVLLRQRCPSTLAPDVNPGVSDLGLMLPSSALHDLLLAAFGGPLVCTSGNVEGEPLAFRIDDAEVRLAGIADLFLHHDRDIEHPIDDSVIRIMAHQPVTLRAARGIAPIPLEIPRDLVREEVILACGGHQKSAVGLSNGAAAMLGPHVGDLDSLASQDRWEEQTDGLSRLVGATNLSATTLGCDHHPRYFSTEWCRRRRQRTAPIWHHHAHIVTGMIEHGWLDREVLGVAWDGTGLGPDGTIWGGEFLRATAASFERVAHLRPFRLPGGERCTTDLRRTALSILTQLGDAGEQETSKLLPLDEGEVCRLIAVLDSNYSPLTTSCGRLFDAAACLILGQAVSDYEGHAALSLESVCRDSEPGAYVFPIEETSTLQIDWRPAFRAIVSDRRAQTPASVMAMRFHRGLAHAVAAVARRYAHLPVVLGGGVFQNRVLVETIVKLWHNDNQPLALPGRLPPNDGGLAAGQLAAVLMSAEFRKEPTDVSGSSGKAGCLDRSRSVAGES